jgi:hypothetical protein
MTQMAVAFHSPDTDLEIDVSHPVLGTSRYSLRLVWRRVTRATSVVDRIGSRAI